MSKICIITGKKKNNAYSISHSHVRTKKIQNVNLQKCKVWLSDRKSWVSLKISTKAMKTLVKKNYLVSKKLG
uniref:Large ribosomal subunit protein bL28c n=1 Tax=Hommersandiophycus borowitzkae TaxID=268573 RepID=A0A1G4NTX0_9FLOR|nr:Ribosomal protein L28 [Hommersandiophycus borowitzkae]SCW22141.1 Ribosomal protein L28 [Hommersandiophycus borowitzkae]